MTGDATPLPAFRRMSFFNASRRVFDLSLGEMLWSRRTIFMALIVGGPVLLALIVKVIESFGLPALRINNQRMAGFSIFGVKTITYLFTRPVPRGAVLVGKFLAYLACTFLVVLPSVMVVYFLLVPLSQVPATFGKLLIDLGLLALGLAAYGGVFSLVGSFFKRPLVIGLIFAFGWEQVVLLIPGSLKQFTIAFYMQGLVPHAMPSEGVTSILQGLFQQNPPAWVCLAWLFAFLGGFLYLATRVVERKEYILEQ